MDERVAPAAHPRSEPVSTYTSKYSSNWTLDVCQRWFATLTVAYLRVRRMAALVIVVSLKVRCGRSADGSGPSGRRPVRVAEDIR